MTEERTESSSCAEVRAILAAFLADEIPPDASRRVQAHLDACPPCARYRGLEESFDGALRRGLRTGAAPASLVLRIHERLALEDAPPMSWWLRALPSAPYRWAAAAAAVLLLLLVPSVVAFRAGAARSAVPRGVELVRRGVLVCATCDRAAVPVDRQRGCRAFGHHAAFRCPRTGTWQFVENETTRPLLTDADHYGDPMEIRGIFDPENRYVKVEGYTYVVDSVAPADSGL